jgi:hypothetical protein
MKDYFPRVVTLQEIIREAQQSIAQIEGNPSGNYELQDPITEEEEARERYYRSASLLKQFEFLGPRYGYGISLLYVSYSDEDRKVLNKIVDGFRDSGVYTVSRWMSYCKYIGTKLKQIGGPVISNWWKFVDLERTGGWLPIPETRDLFDEVREWVAGKISPQLENPIFLTKFREGVRKFLRSGTGLLQANTWMPSPKRFVSDAALWAKSGSTTIDRRPTYVWAKGGKIVQTRARKTKWAAALASTPNQLYKLLFSEPKVNLYKAIPKREQGKVRLVIASPTHLHLKMSYVSYWLESVLDGSPLSTLFYSPRQMSNMWIDMAKNTVDSDTWKIPIDQSKFDYNVTKGMLRICIEEIERMVDSMFTASHKSSVLWMIHAIKESLLEFRNVIETNDPKYRHSVTYEKGVLSGWRWTALLDTMVNIGEFYVAAGYLGSYTDVLRVVAQGDDDLVWVKRANDAVVLAEAYRLMGLDVNPKKFFISQNRDEYLRLVADSGKLVGYPARVVSSILWRNPVARDPQEGILRVNESIDSWSKLIGRGGDINRVLPMMITDITRGNSINEHQFARLAQTPASVGGLGLVNMSGDNVRGELNWMELFMGTSGIVNGRYMNVPGYMLLIKELQIPYKREDLNNLIEVDARHITESGTTRAIQRTKPYNYSVPYGFGGSIEPVFRDKDIWRTFRSTKLRTLIQEGQLREVDELTNKAELSYRLRQRGGKRVWMSWVLSDLPYRPPNILGVNRLIVGQVFNHCKKFCWMKMVSKSRFTWTNVLRSAVTAELWTRVWVERFFKHITA